MSEYLVVNMKTGKTLKFVDGKPQVFLSEAGAHAAKNIANQHEAGYAVVNKNDYPHLA